LALLSTDIIMPRENFQSLTMKRMIGSDLAWFSTLKKVKMRVYEARKQEYEYNMKLTLTKIAQAPLIIHPTMIYGAGCK
jgi:hypothetical protein